MHHATVTKMRKGTAMSTNMGTNTNTAIPMKPAGTLKVVITARSAS